MPSASTQKYRQTPLAHDLAESFEIIIDYAAASGEIRMLCYAIFYLGWNLCGIGISFLFFVKDICINSYWKAKKKSQRTSQNANL